MGFSLECTYWRIAQDVLARGVVQRKPGYAPLAIRIQKHLAEPLPLISDSRPDLPGQIDEVIQRATAKEPKDRFPDTLTLAEAFWQAVHGWAAQRLSQRACFLVGALAVALVLAAFALVNGNRAMQNAELANSAEAEAIAQRDAAQAQSNLATPRELSLAALNNLEADPQLSILLAVRALETSHTKEAEEGLHWALQASRVLMILADHTDVVEGVAYSADGLAKVWDAESGEELLVLEGHKTAREQL